MTNHTVDTPDPDTVVRLAWLDTDLDGLPVRFWVLIGLLITAVVIGIGAWWTYGWGHETQASSSTVAAAVVSTS